jgi:hypothetical protein
VTVAAGTCTGPVERIAAARANGFGLALVPGPATGPGWRDAHAWVHDPALRDDLVALAQATAGTDRPVGVAWFFEKHAWHVASLVVAALLSERALPPLHRAQLLFGEYGWADAVAVPGDGWEPCATPADAAAALEAHLFPVVEGLRGLRAPRALWREAGDRLGQAVLWCGEAFGAREEAWALGTAMLEAPTRLRAPARFQLRDGEPFRPRTGCCLAHRAPGYPTCPDCPLSCR